MEVKFTVEQIIDREALHMGRPCELVDSWRTVFREGRMLHEVWVVIYKPEPITHYDITSHEIRLAVYVDGEDRSSMSIGR